MAKPSHNAFICFHAHSFILNGELIFETFQSFFRYFTLSDSTHEYFRAWLASFASPDFIYESMSRLRDYFHTSYALF